MFIIGLGEKHINALLGHKQQEFNHKLIIMIY